MITDNKVFMPQLLYALFFKLVTDADSEYRLFKPLIIDTGNHVFAIDAWNYIFMLVIYARY
jgi:hypothetical protein